MRSKDYSQALDYLYSFIDYERGSQWKYDAEHFDLNRVREFLSSLGDPHERGVYVHVAGTNGKGSVAAMVAASLTEAGYTTGLYTSPHLITFRERIRINGTPISREDVVEGVRRIRKHIKKASQLTFFDVWTGLAFDHFTRKSVEAAVIEVGLGGKLDSTNVITPEVAVITSVSLDHQGKLGDTIEDIAREKAGIIKPGIPVVTAPQDPAVMAVIEERARVVGAPCIRIGTDVGYQTNNSRLYYSGLEWRLGAVNLPLTGAFQHQNAAVALAALEILASRGFSLPPETARTGIESVRWPGRLQKGADHPEVVVDCACNIGAMTVVRDYLKEREQGRNIVAVVGMNADKDCARVIDILGEVVSCFVFTRVDNPRAFDPEEMKRFCTSHHAHVEPDPVNALKRAQSQAGKDGLVMVTGSMYLVGEIMRHLGVQTQGTMNEHVRGRGEPEER